MYTGRKWQCKAEVAFNFKGEVMVPDEISKCTYLELLGGTQYDTGFI